MNNEQPPRRRGPKKAPPDQLFQRWNVTLPPDVSAQLEDAQRPGENRSELLTRVATIIFSDDMIAALPWIQEARGMCFSESAQRGLDQLIAALWVAKNKQEEIEHGNQH